MSGSLLLRMREGGYDGYSYAYPHKTAYRTIHPAVPLSDAWSRENRRNLFLYVHLPFCEMRCGFCNLFTTVSPGQGFVAETLAAIERQSRVTAEAVQPGAIAQAAFGGGTPSFLSEAELARLFQSLQEIWPADWRRIPVSFEMSPGTVSESKLRLLKEVGVDRISLGVQSFERDDLVSLKRPQPRGELENVCRMIKTAGFEVFNIDLIYGNEGQDVARWERSLRAALNYDPEELYLYPVYVRRLTNLERSGKKPGEHRRELYRCAREVLMERGYRQVSMRLFRRADVRRDTDYCCQEDGMVGLGPGARSYTRDLHYSSEYAVGQSGIREIVERFNQRTDREHRHADYGIRLTLQEQKLRYLIKSLLRVDGICLGAYQARFGTEVQLDSPQMEELIELKLAVDDGIAIRLTEEGLEWSDTVGPWLYSEAVKHQMSAYELA